MRFKICAFNKPGYAQTTKELVVKLKANHFDSSVSVKYIKKSGMVAVLFVDVLSNGECRGSHSDLPINFNELDKLAAASFELEPTLLGG